MIKLIEVDDYDVRIKALLFETEYPVLFAEAESHVKAFSKTLQAVRDNKGLLVLLALVREVGNFLNYKSFAGGACGFPLASVIKLADVKAGDGSTLMNFVAHQLEHHHETAMTELKVRLSGCLS